ncbi:hypothetical protein [Devosia elaeis]|uniref:DUF2635 domain-containing protein n=1 Tax=Devosia elaeis TaxID=1770058 RepID=A0A178HLM9_9HYPH|nr:hypothetical protein [Devosia elaeis]OAM73762.1 hypothetical protein A3840_17360 [Devosia elaeis]
MGKFIYKGPMSAATLRDGTDVILMNGREVTLPDNNEWVQSLVAQKRLVPVTAQRSAPKAQGKTAPQPADKETK